MSEKSKVLIGYDGSEYAENIIENLNRMGLPDAVEVFVATVSEMWIRMPLSYGGVETSYANEDVSGISEARQIAAVTAEKIKEKFPQWSVDFGAAVGSPAGILLSKADEWKPNLIVVGSHSRGAIGRFFLGSVAQTLVNNAFCSVRVVRLQENNPISDSEIKLVVGVDGSEDSEKAIEEIISRNWKSDCTVHIVSAMDYLVPLARFDLVTSDSLGHTEHFKEELEKTQITANKAIQKLDRAGFFVTSAIKNQNPRDLLIEQAKEINADCIFVGAKGMSRLERLLVGSVSSSVAVRAECSVEVVRKL